MTESLNIKITSYSTPLFLKCQKATTIPTNSFDPPTSYLLLPSTQFSNHTNKNSICRTMSTDQQNCLIQLQGECLHRYLLARRNQVVHRVMEQQQIWNLIAGVVSGFYTLRRLGCAHKYTHFKQYCIRRIPDINGQLFKLIYHESMISQLEIAKTGNIPWHTLYLSPQQLTLKFQPQKSIVFSLGLMLLNICSNLDRNRTIYKKDKYQISRSTIRYKLRLAAEQYGYSKLLVGFMRICLEGRVQKRMDFQGLWRYLDQVVKGERLKNWAILAAIKYQQEIHQNDDSLDISSSQAGSNAKSQKQQKQSQQQRQLPGVGRIRTQLHNLPKQLVQPSSSSSSASPRSIRSSLQYSPIKKPTSQDQHTNQKLYESRQYKQEEKQPEKNKQSQGQQSQAEFVTTRSKDRHPEYSNQIKIQIQINEDVPRISDSLSANEQQNNRFSERIQRNTLTQSPNFRYSIHTFPIPELETQLKSLKLADCLKPIPQLIKSIGQHGIWIEGDVYYGKFYNGKRQGLGLEVYADGGYYYGHFRQDLYEGEGFYMWNQAEYFFGIFKSGLKVKGRLQGPTRYQGQFKHNRRHGHGTCWYPTGQIYSGGWQADKRHGEGFVIESEGPKFVGSWFQGKRKGEGYLQTDIMRIAGDWNNQQIQGQTLIQYSNGDAFKGITNSELQKIQGEYISTRGDIFRGSFENNQPKKGKLVYSNGQYYVGELINMKRSGYGQYYYKDGNVCRGRWQDNFIKEMQNSLINKAEAYETKGK